MKKIKFPFAGSFEFQLTMSCLGHSTERKVRVEYKHHPAWSYIDPDLMVERLSHEMHSSLSLHLLAQPNDGMDDLEPEWIKCSELIENGVLPTETWETIDDMIDDRCRAEDQKRREIAVDRKK